MNSLNKKLKTPLFSAAIIALSLITVGQMVYASSKDPGSQEDPLVTMSYVELKLQQLKDYVDQKSFSSNGESNNSTQSQSYEVVEIRRGESLIAEAGTEIILRSGEAIAIISPLGGLSDVTGAKDLQRDEKVPANHLLIIPRADGRGIRAVSDCFLLVRGGYTIN